MHTSPSKSASLLSSIRKNNVCGIVSVIVVLIWPIVAIAANSPFEATPLPVLNSEFKSNVEHWAASSDGVITQRDGTLTMPSGSSINQKLTVSRGNIDQRGRRCIVRVRARVESDAWLQLRVLCEGSIGNAILRSSDDWQTIVAVVDTPPLLPGANTADIEISISVQGAGSGIVESVHAESVTPYGLLMRLTSAGTDSSRYAGDVRIIRHHRDTNHPDGERHRYFSTIEVAPFNESTGWIDLRRFLFGSKVATASINLRDAATGKAATDAQIKIELAIPASSNGGDIESKSTSDLMINLEDEIDAFELEDPSATSREPIQIYELTAILDNGVISLLLPENQTPPEQFVSSISDVKNDVANRLTWINSEFPDEARLPRKIMVGANISPLDNLVGKEEMQQEAVMLRRIGISSVARSLDSKLQDIIDESRSESLDGNFQDRMYWRLSNDDIISPYDGNRLAVRLAEHFNLLRGSLERTSSVDHIGLVELFDEPPDFALTEQDVPQFRNFLTDLGVNPEEVGFENWNQVRPWGLTDPELAQNAAPLPDLDDNDAELLLDQPDLDQPARAEISKDAPLENRRLYYYTRVFNAQRTADIFRTATEAAQDHLPNVETSVNFRAGIRRVLTPETADWFEAGRRRSVTMLWNEDWLNTYGWRNNGIQLVSYYTELMHAASRPHQLPHGCFVIVMGHTLEKAYSALSHGATRVSFWRYGPAYANYLPYSWSHSRDAVSDIATFSRDVAAIEDTLLESSRHEATVALLYAKSDPLWGYSQAENRLVGFALSHDQVPWEIITEAEVEEDEILSTFKTVYVTDISVRRRTQERLAAWVAKGGAIWLSADAATRDEFHEPCTILRDSLQDSSNAARSEKPFVQTEGVAGNGRYQIMAVRPGELYEEPVRRQFNRNLGKGRIQTGWPVDLRHAISSFVDTDLATKPVVIDTACVEAMLYRHQSDDLLFLINYTGRPDPVDIEITLRDRPNITAVTSLRHGEIDFVRRNDDVVIKTQLDRADTLQISHNQTHQD